MVYADVNIAGEKRPCLSFWLHFVGETIHPRHWSSMKGELTCLLCPFVVCRGMKDLATMPHIFLIQTWRSAVTSAVLVGHSKHTPTSSTPVMTKCTIITLVSSWWSWWQQWWSSHLVVLCQVYAVILQHILLLCGNSSFVPHITMPTLLYVCVTDA